MVDFDVNIKLSANSAAQAIANIQGGLENVERSAKGAENALDNIGNGSRTLRKIEQELSAVEDALKDVEVGSDSFNKLARSAGTLDKELSTARQSVRGLGDEVDNAGKKFINFDDIARGAMMRVGEMGVEALMGLGRAAIGFGVDSVRVFAEFETSMKNVQALSGATEDEYKQLSEAARDLGASTRYSASEAADAMGFLAMAGFEVNEVLSATPAMLNLATAGSLELAEAADIASNVMGQYAIAATEVEMVTNVLAATAASANTDVSQMAEALKYLGPTASSLNMSLEETAAVIGVLGDSGIQASMAGRALGSSLVRMADPTNKMKDAMEQLNVAAFDASGEFVGMEDLLGQLEKGLVGFTDEQKAATLSALFGAEAFQEINILLNKGADAYGEYTESITDTEKAMEIAGIKGEGLAGNFAILSSATQEAQISIGEGLNPALMAGTQFLTEFITELFAGDSATASMSSASEKLAAAISAINVGKLVSDLKQVIGVAADVASAISKVIGFLNQLNQLNPLTLITRANAAIAGNLYGSSSNARNSNVQVATVGAGYSTGGLVTGGSGNGTADDIPIMVSSGEYVVNADAVRAAGKEYLDTINSGKTNIGALRASPSMMMSGGDATAAAGAFGQKMGEALQGFYRQGNIGPTSTGAHFDIKRQDKSRFERTDLDQYVTINGNRSLSSGTTVRGGEFGARRSYGSHNGWDFAFGGQADLSLKNGAQWTGNTKTQHGDKASFMTPDGKVYEILHGTFQGQAKPVAPVSAAQTVANMPSASKAVGIASSLKAQLGLTDAQAAGIVGNFMREAGKDLNPRINEGGKVGLPMGRGGYGLAQWTGSRQNDLVNFAGGKEAAGSLEKQVAFTIKELLGSEKNALAKLKQTNTPEEAAAAFEKYYERAGVVALGERQANARQVYGEIKSGAPGASLSGGGTMGYTDAESEHNKAIDQAADSIARQTERLAENVAQSQLRNVGLKMQLDLLRQTSDEDKNAAKIVETQLEQGVDRIKLEEELKQKLEAKLLTEQEVTMTLEKFDELQAKKIASMKEEQAILADLESLQAFNEEWQKFAESSAASVETSGDRVALLEQEIALVQSGTENYGQALTMIQAEMEIKQQLLEIQTQLNDQLERGNVTQEQASEILANAAAAGQAKLEGLHAEIEATNTLSAAQEVQSQNRAKQAEVESTYQQLIDNATGAFTNFATSVLSGSESAGEAVKKLASTILSNLANKAMSSLFGSLFGGIFGGGGGGGGGFKLFADGGIVDKPTNAIIGEAGAEAVIPLKGGMVPVKMMGGGGGDITNITVNVSSQGGGEGQDGRVLGRQISEAIKAEIANQKRSGGLLR